MTETRIPDNHPRAKSLRTRELLKDAVASGLVHATGLIAHGRGEAYDYLLGEKTSRTALEAIQQAAETLRNAKNPVVSVNGNVAALAAKELVQLQQAAPFLKFEVNVFHRAPGRIEKIIDFLEEKGLKSVLGKHDDFRVPGLESDRGRCTMAGIGSADVVLVPLEDGDRCEALVAMGKTVIVVDLNPLSRTAKMAHITIVDELTRAIPHLARACQTPAEITKKPNKYYLDAAKSAMAKFLVVS